MAVDFSTMVYSPNYDMWARDVVITPLVSQPGAPAYTARGIYTTDPVDIGGLDGVTITSDQRTILDVRDIEFTVVPMQGDLIHIPAEGNIPAEGDFEVIDGDANGGGETTLSIRKWEASTALATTTALDSSPNPSTFGEAAIFTVTVSSSSPTPEGTVCIKVDGIVRAYVTLQNGVATWSPGWSLKVGNHTVEAQFSPSHPLEFNRSQATITQVVS
jgi:Big-like domain-containing protein